VLGFQILLFPTQIRWLPCKKQSCSAEMLQKEVISLQQCVPPAKARPSEALLVGGAMLSGPHKRRAHTGGRITAGQPSPQHLTFAAKRARMLLSQMAHNL